MPEQGCGTTELHTMHLNRVLVLAIFLTESVGRRHYILTESLCDILGLRTWEPRTRLPVYIVTVLTTDRMAINHVVEVGAM